jgi:uncharacterized protein (TIGR02271 family)
MLNRDEMFQAVGADAYGSDGEKIGKVGQVFLDDETDEAAWATVNTGLFGRSESFVPLGNASFTDGRLVVGYPKDTVKGAPNISDEDGHLTPDQERALYEYYGMGYTPWSGEARTQTEPETSTSARHLATEPTSTPASTSSDDAMTLSEERVRMSGTTSQPVGRARLRKVVETEYVTQTVPVRRERIVVENDPVAGGDAEGATGDEVGPEIELHEERPVLEKTVEPVERVRLGKEEYTDEETVSEDVRRERVETEGDVVDRTRRE